MKIFNILNFSEKYEKDFKIHYISISHKNLKNLQISKNNIFEKINYKEILKKKNIYKLKINKKELN